MPLRPPLWFFIGFHSRGLCRDHIQWARMVLGSFGCIQKGSEPAPPTMVAKCFGSKNAPPTRVQTGQKAWIVAIGYRTIASKGLKSQLLHRKDGKQSRQYPKLGLQDSVAGQQKRTFTGTLSASWSWDLLYFKGWLGGGWWRSAVGGWWRLAAVGGWRLVSGGWWRLGAVLKGCH